VKWSRAALMVVAQVQAAVPLLLIGGLAAYTWWLVQSTPDGSQQARREPPASTPDYVLGEAVVERFDAAGRRVSVLRGQSMSHFVSGDRLQVQHLQLVAQDPKGQHVQATAKEGRYLGTGSVVDLIGGAHVTATPASGAPVTSPVVFDGEALTVEVDQHVLSSSRPVHLTHANGDLHGSSLRYDARSGISVVGGRVTGSYKAPAP
jgi:lipopolysaccharide export system protein LptC